MAASWISTALDGAGDYLGSTGSSIAPYAVMGLLNYFTNQNKSSNDSKIAGQTREFNALEAQKERDAAKELLQLRLGAEAGAGGGGAGAAAAAAKAGLIGQAYGNAQNTALQGGQMQVSTLMQMIQAIQNGLGKV